MKQPVVAAASPAPAPREAAAGGVVGGGARPQHRKVFIGGVPQEMDQAELQKEFAKWGIVRKAWLQKCRTATARSAQGQNNGNNNAMQKHRGFGFIIFEDVSTINKLLGGPHISSRFMMLPNGRKIEVKRAISSSIMAGKEESPEAEPRQKGIAKAKEELPMLQAAAATTSCGQQQQLQQQQHQQMQQQQPERQALPLKLDGQWPPGPVTMTWSMVDGQQQQQQHHGQQPTLSSTQVNVPAWSFPTQQSQAAAPNNIRPGSFHMAHPGVLQHSGIGIIMPPGVRRPSLSHELPSLVEESNAESIEDPPRPHSFQQQQRLTPKGLGCQLMLQQPGEQQQQHCVQPGPQQGSPVSPAVAMILRPVTPPSIPHQVMHGELSPVTLSPVLNFVQQRSGTPIIDMDQRQRQPSVLEAAMHSKGGSNMSCAQRKEMEKLLKDSVPDHYDD
jgi:hypothetical protein